MAPSSCRHIVDETQVALRLDVFLHRVVSDVVEILGGLVEVDESGNVIDAKETDKIAEVAVPVVLAFMLFMLVMMIVMTLSMPLVVVPMAAVQQKGTGDIDRQTDPGDQYRLSVMDFYRREEAPERLHRHNQGDPSSPFCY